MSKALTLTKEEKKEILSTDLMEIKSYQGFSEIAVQLIDSAFMPKHIQDVPTLASILMYGRELGYTPMSSIQNIINISGKLSLTSAGMAAAIRQAGIRWTLVEDMEPVMGQVWVNPDDPSEGTTEGIRTHRTTMEFMEFWRGEIIRNRISITWEEAEVIATNNYQREMPDTYIKYAKHMLVARLLTRGARLFCPEALSGTMYSPLETAMEAGRPIEVVDGYAEEVNEEQAAYRQSVEEDVLGVQRDVHIPA